MTGGIRQVIGFELKRIVQNKINQLIFIVLIFLSVVVLVNTANIKKQSIENEQIFRKFEDQKFKSYINYIHYSNDGFKVFFNPGPSQLVFNKWSLYNELASKVDDSEIIDVTSSMKTRNLFRTTAFGIDISWVVFFIGSVLFFINGLFSLPEYRSFVRLAMFPIKWLLLSVMFLLYLSSVFLIQIALNNELLTEVPVISMFLLNSVLLASVFYFVALCIQIAFTKKVVRYIVASVVWSFCVFILPEFPKIFMGNNFQSIELSESINLKKLEELKAFSDYEKKQVADVKEIDRLLEIYKITSQKFLNEGYVKNTELEKAVNNKMYSLFKKYENYSCFFPTAFFKFTAVELSNKGFYSYFDYMEYVLKIRDKFLRFILERKFDRKNAELIDFTKNDENFFKAQSSRHMGQYSLGLIITSLYSLLLFLTAFFLYKNKQNKTPNVLESDFQTEPKDFLFVYCRDNEVMDSLFNHYVQTPGYTCVDNVNGRDIDMGVHPAVALPHMCNVLGSNLELAVSHLRALGFPNIAQAPHDDETYRLFYLAAQIAREYDIMVVKDFVRHQTREFQARFMKLMDSEMDMERSVIYLSTQLYQTAAYEKLIPEMNNVAFCKLSPIENIFSADLR